MKCYISHPPPIYNITKRAFYGFQQKTITLLAIFCIIASAGVVCAADQDGYAGRNYDMVDADGLDSGQSLPLENQTGNVTNNATQNMTASHKMPLTDNAVIVLLVVVGIIGGYTVMRRNKEI